MINKDVMERWERQKNGVVSAMARGGTGGVMIVTAERDGGQAVIA